MRKLNKNEIDLSGIIIFLLTNKLKIFLITLITVIILFSLNQSMSQREQKSFLIEAQVYPISYFDMFDYQEYNNFIMKFQEDNNNSRNIFFEGMMEGESETYYYPDLYQKFKNDFQKNNLQIIDSMFLYALFISIINEEERLINLIKKINIIKKEKFQNNELYEKTVKKLASSIQVADYNFIKEKNIKNPSLNFSNIRLKIENKEDGEKLLNLIIENISNDIKNHLSNEFENLIQSSNRIREYTIEDIEYEILNNSNDKIIVNKLDKLKKRIERNKDTERLISLFQNTPIYSDKFSAAKIKAISYTDLNKKNNFIILFKLIVLGLLLSIIYIMTEKIIKNQQKK